jgi:protein-disulfide isomerase
VAQEPETQESLEAEKTSQPKEAPPKAKNVQPPAGDQGLPPLALQFIVGIVAAVVVVAIAAGINHAWPIFGTSGSSSGSSETAAVANPTPSGTAAPVVVAMDVGDAPSQGPKDAKVTIVEFSDFECPYCARFVEQTMPQILQNYGNKVQFAFRNFPLTSMHPYAEKAAEASECANDQGAFWQYHDLLFQNQDTLAGLVSADATNGVNQVIEKLKGYAAGLNLDTNAFNQCLDSGADKAKVDSDMAAMQDALTKAGVTRFGTPSFFINGRFISGAYPYDENSSGYQAGQNMFTFKQGIEDALAAAK